MTETSPTVSQLLVRAERAEQCLADIQTAAKQLADKAQTTLSLINLMNSHQEFGGNNVTRLIAMYLRDAIDAFDTWENIGF